MSIGHKLAFCFIFLSIFNFSSNSGDNLVSPVLIFTRIAPLIISPLLIFFSLKKSERLMSLSYFFKIPYFFIFWYSILSIISGFISDIQPFWGLWKQYELLVSLYFFISLSIVVKRAPFGFNQFLGLLYLLCFLLISWVVYYNLIIKDLALSNFIFFRFNNEFPTINAIQLAVICSFGIIYSLSYLTKRNASIGLLWKIFMFISIVVFGLVFLAAKSRTAIFSLIIIIIGGLFSRTFVLKKKINLVIFLITGSFFLSNEVLGFLRIGDLTELVTAGGRISSNYYSNSSSAAWPETINFIKEKLILGYGSLNLERFIAEKSFSVDNFILQLVVSSGIVGSFMYIIFFVCYQFMWLKIIFTRALNSRLFLIVLGSFVFGTMKGLTTDDLAYNGIGFVLFMTSIIYYFNFRRIDFYSFKDL